MDEKEITSKEKVLAVWPKAKVIESYVGGKFVSLGLHDGRELAWRRDGDEDKLWDDAAATLPAVEDRAVTCADVMLYEATGGEMSDTIGLDRQEPQECSGEFGCPHCEEWDRQEPRDGTYFDKFGDRRWIGTGEPYKADLQKIPSKIYGHDNGRPLPATEGQPQSQLSEGHKTWITHAVAKVRDSLQNLESGLQILGQAKTFTDDPNLLLDNFHWTKVDDPHYDLFRAIEGLAKPTLPATGEELPRPLLDVTQADRDWYTAKLNAGIVEEYRRKEWPFPEPGDEDWDECELHILRRQFITTLRQLAELRAENERLRAALIETGRSVGCLLSDGVSNKFIAEGVPGEVKAKLSQAQAKVTELQQRVADEELVSAHANELIGKYMQDVEAAQAKVEELTAQAKENFDDAKAYADIAASQRRQREAAESQLQQLMERIAESDHRISNEQQSHAGTMQALRAADSRFQQLREELEKPIKATTTHMYGGGFMTFYKIADIDARRARMREIAKDANDKAPQAATEIREADPQAEAT